MFWFRGLRSQSDNFISMVHGPCEHKPAEWTRVNGQDCMETIFCSNRTMQKNQRESLKAIQVLIPSRRPNLIPGSLPEISIILSASEIFCPGHVCAVKTTYLVPDGISEVAHYNIPQNTLGTKTSKGLQWGRVKGLESRAIPILEPWELSPGGILDTS